MCIRDSIENARFLCGDAGEVMQRLAAEGQPVDVVLMDPPRAGASLPFLDSLLHLAPRRVIYVLSLIHI